MSLNRFFVTPTTGNLIQDKCGLVGIYSSTFTSHLPLALTAASGVQHRGTQGAGIALYTKTGLKTHIGHGLIQDVFDENTLKNLDHKSLWTLVHCRYGTSGNYVKENLQPITLTSGTDKITLIHNGEFAGAAKLKKMVRAKLPKGVSDTYMFAELLKESSGSSWDEKILSLTEQMKGAFNLLIGINDTLYAVRDPWGLRPLVLGKYRQGWVVTSETHALDKISVKAQREVGRGEVLKFDKKGITRLRKPKEGAGNFCDFEWAYFSRPNSLLPTYENKDDGQHPQNWMSVTEFRERCGKTLAHESPIRHATFVVGIPDSGIHIAVGYAEALGIRYRQVIIRDHYDRNGNERLFMRDDDIHHIKTKVLGKLAFTPDPRIWKDAVVVLGDDSIVRGNVAREVTRAVRALGAREVHWIVGFPPVLFRCHLGVSMRTEAELIAPKYQADPIKIARAIGATSIRYISKAGLLQAKFDKKRILKSEDENKLFLLNGGCGGCLTGVYPVTFDGVTN